MVVKEKRKYQIFAEVEKFLDTDNKKQKKTMIFRNSEEVMLVKEFLYERDAQVEVVNEYFLSNREISITLKKM